MKVVMMKIEELHPYPGNPRINEAAVPAIVNSIREFGFRQPIVALRNGEIVVGHTRYRAAIELGLKQVPVHFADDLSPAQIRAYRIADNRLNEIALWDEELLARELKALAEMELDLDLLGFSDKELASLLEQDVRAGLVDEDEIPLPPDEATTQEGDIWVLGEHRLLNGDSANPEHLAQLLDGSVIDLVNTDPPYNVNVEPRSNNAIAAGNSSFSASKKNHHQQFDARRRPGARNATHKKLRAKDRPLVNDFLAEEAFNNQLISWFQNISDALRPGGSFYIWGGYANLGNYPAPLKAAGLYFSQGIVWDKQHPVLTRKDFMGSFEICFYGWKEGAAHKFYGPNNATDLWHLKKVNPQSMIHLTEKPVELAVRAIQYSSRAGDNVLDLFGGSGSTLIAAEQTGRCAFLMEIDPLYSDVIVARWEKFTGKKPKRIQCRKRRGVKHAG